MKKILPVILLCLSFNAHAQYKAPWFNTLTVESGLPEAYIVSTVQDKYGYLWFGTQNGLVRYDGYTIKPYPVLTDDGTPVAAPTIELLYEDSRGKLWAYIFNEGIYYLDRTKDALIKQPIAKDNIDSIKITESISWKEEKKSNTHWLLFNNPANNKKFVFHFDALTGKREEYSTNRKNNYFIPAYKSASVSVDRSGKTWLITDSLLSYYEPATKSFKPFFLLPDTASSGIFYALVNDPVDPDLLWLNSFSKIPTASGTKTARKLFLFNTKTKEYKTFITGADQPGRLASECIYIFADSLKRVWASTEKGISLYNMQTGSFTNYPIELGTSQIYPESLAADKEGNLWLGITSKLFYLNVKTGVTTKYESSDKPGGLPIIYGISKIFFDRSGTLWINMPHTGIARLDRQKSLFAALPPQPFGKITDNKTVSSQFGILGNRDDSICFIRDTANLFAWNTIRNTYKKIDIKDPKIIKQIGVIVPAPDESLWMSTNTSGIINYQPATGTITKFKNDPKDSSSLASNYANALAVDKAGTVWIGTIDKGLSSYNPRTKVFTRYPFVHNNFKRQVKDSLDDEQVLTLYFDSDGLLWIGTNFGSLNSFNTQTKKFRSYLNYKKGFFCVLAIKEDSQKRLWVGTYQCGVYLVNRQTGTLRRITEKEGLLHNEVYDLKEDGAGNIWALTRRGMSRISPRDYSITNFTDARLWYNNFINYSNFQDGAGIFHLSGKNGIISFNPLQLQESKTSPAVIIESIGYNSHGVIDTVLQAEGRKKIKLRYNENKIIFQYVALHYSDASANKYAYWLEGYDKDWIPAGTQRSVSYTNLAPGTYTFKVKAANSDGLWNETGASLTIIISPPWWKTWWAYLLYVLIFGFAVWSYINYYRKKIQRENIILEEKVQHRTSQLQTSIADLKATQQQLIQSEKMASLGELTAGIAHEIQNPLNFVNNFSEVSNELIDEMKEELSKGNYDDAKEIADDVKQNLEKITHHGKRAGDIVKGMLQHSRSSSGQKEPTDINKLADEYLRLAYHGLRAKDKSFNATMKTDYDESIGNINIIPQDIGRVILNLITNAFYAAPLPPEEGFSDPDYVHNPTVWVSTKKEGNKVLISVRDNGPGIPQKILDKIFQPFFTTKPTGQGTGLGLSLSYDIVKAHGGELKVETKESEGLPAGQAGATFILSIPITNINI